MSPDVMDVRPREVIREVAAAVPADLHGNLVIVGSLAVALHLVEGDSPVRTKDVDCVLTPQLTAVEKGAAVARRLLALGWEHRQEGAFADPGGASTPVHELPAVRLYPPGSHAWFLELLAEPRSENQLGREWERIELPHGHYGLPSFPFMKLAAHEASMDSSGLHIARPEMMAIAHLLEQRAFPETAIEGSEFDGRPLKRRNKDLGRVLAIAMLLPAESLDDWPIRWLRGLESCFPTRWRELALEAGNGLSRLLGSPADLAEATHVCNDGLLAGRPRTADELRAVGARIMRIAVAELEEAVRR